MSAKSKVCAIVLVIVMGTARSTAEPLPLCTSSDPCHLRMREPTTVKKDDGTEYRLPPGHFYDNPTNQLLDDELKRLQNQETRLTAENKSLRESMDTTWKPGWFTLVTALVLGAAAGVGGYYWYENR